jgi:Cu/Ag efflux protein CusF
MKKIGVILTGVFFVLAAVGVGFAQEKAKPEKPSPSAQAKVSKGEEVKGKSLLKAGEYRLGGMVTKIDSAGKKITIKQSKVKGERVATLKMDKSLAKEMSMIKVGDVVNVWVQGKNIKSLNKVG